MVINDYTLASNSFTAYADKQNGYATGYTTTSGQPLYAYIVYPVNSTEATTIYSTDTNKIGVDGFYTVVKAADGVATDMTQIMGAYGATEHMAAGTYKVSGTATKVNGLYWDRGYTKAFSRETLVNGTGGENDDFYNSYRVTDSTKYYTVTKTTWSDGEYAVITASEASDLAVGDRIVVAYSAADNGTDDVASYVYILKAETYTQDSPADTVGTFEDYFADKTYQVNTTTQAIKCKVPTAKSLAQMANDMSANFTLVYNNHVVTDSDTLTVAYAVANGTLVMVNNTTGAVWTFVQ